MNKFVRQARLPKGAYDQNRDLKEVLGRYKARVEKKNIFTHRLNCKCKECYKDEKTR